MRKQCTGAVFERTNLRYLVPPTQERRSHDRQQFPRETRTHKDMPT